MKDGRMLKENSSRGKNSILNLITGFGGQLFTIVLNFIARTVFITTLGKEYLGINGLFADILTMLSLTELGLDTAINFKLYKPLAEGDQQRCRVLMKFYRDAYRIVAIVMAILGICFIPALPIIIHDYDSLARLNINAIFIFLIYLTQSVSSYLFFASEAAIVKADQHEYLLNISKYIVQTFAFISQILILIIRKSFVEYTISLVLFAILQNVVNAYIARKKYRWAFQKTSESIDKTEIKSIFKDLGALFVFRVNNVIVKATDNIVLSSFIGLVIVGLYSNYLILFNAITSLLGRFYTAVSASVGNLFAVSDTSKKYQFFETMNLITMILYGTAAVGITVTVNELIQVWIGDDYVIPQPFPLLVGLEILFSGIRSNLNGVRNATGVFRQMWWRPLLGAAVNLIVSIALVNPLGIYGVVIGTISADFFTFFLIEPKVLNKYSFDSFQPIAYYYKKNSKYILVLFLTGGVDWMICSHFITGHGWLSLIIHIGVCAISVPVILSITCWNQPEMKYIIGLKENIVSHIAKKVT